MSKSTPTPVRVARWSALAAAITALGSIINTVWTSEPWWVKRHDAIHQVAGTKSLELTMSAAPDPSPYEYFIQYIHTNPISSSLIAVSAIVMMWYTYMEYRHRSDGIFTETPPK